MVRDGRCTELLDERMTKEECCATNGVETAWSSDDLDAGTLFFWRVLGGGVPCHPCRVTLDRPPSQNDGVLFLPPPHPNKMSECCSCIRHREDLLSSDAN
ncbi:hypothetical protein J6590_002788 [Homalodisca vitripennis]|nr:hypothetical protein J6590_002788 [Homalodisca vitripennis]